MIKINLVNENIILEADKDEMLYDVLTRNNIIDAPCGGSGVCGKCRVDVDGISVLSCLYKLEKDITVITRHQNKVTDIISDGFCKSFTRDIYDKGNMGIAVDIGTTTVVASLIDLHTGKEICSMSCLNSQKSFGQDVITRIQYAVENKDGLKKLQQTIINDIANLFNIIYENEKINPDCITRVVISGNTTMIYLLIAENPEGLAKAPYKLSFEGAVKCDNSVISLPVGNNCNIYCLPAISAYVGGDITAGILACDLKNISGIVLFIDIGTNGEIVLSNNGELSCCSCAAGPALEGMNISCGTRACVGAIEDVAIKDNKIVYKTIKNENAVGICGSGLLSAISELNKNHILHTSGRFLNSDFIQNVEGKKYFVIDKDRNIYITQKDIRQVQLAKGAILSGINALLQNENISVSDVERVIVAGQFGAHLNAESLTNTGILPKEWADRIEYVGNTSKSGAYICLLSDYESSLAEKIVKNIKYVELSTLSDYKNLFIQCLNF